MGRSGGRSRSGRRISRPDGLSSEIRFRQRKPSTTFAHPTPSVPLSADPVLEKFVPSKLYDFAQWVDQLWLFQTARPAR